METRNLLIQIALLILGAFILFKVFSIDANQKIIKNNIEKSITEIQDAEKNLEAAQEEITGLEKEIEQFKIERDLLETQKDSIVLSYRKELEDDRDELEEIKKDIKENTDKLDRLRERNKDFALTVETSDEDEGRKEINNAIRQSHEDLKNAIDSILKNSSSIQ